MKPIYETCDICQRMKARYGEENLKICERCGHYYDGEKCTCDPNYTSSATLLRGAHDPGPQTFLVVFDNPTPIEEDDLNAVIEANMRGTWARLRGWSTFKRTHLLKRQDIAESLAYAIHSTLPAPFTARYKGELEELDGGLVERLIVSEFWHALNRRGLPNDTVDGAIIYTYEHLKQWRGLKPQISKTVIESMRKAVNDT